MKMLEKLKDKKFVQNDINPVFYKNAIKNAVDPGENRYGLKTTNLNEDYVKNIVIGFIEIIENEIILINHFNQTVKDYIEVINKFVKYDPSLLNLYNIKTINNITDSNLKTLKLSKFINSLNVLEKIMSKNNLSN